MPTYKFEVKPNLIFRPQETQKPAYQPADDNQYNLSYACLLIPRFHSHYLVGDLVEYLYVWIQEICISYGWKLDSLDVQASYLQWLVDVSVSESPAKIIQTIRQQTSKNIFEDFPRFKKQNSGKDFWAPGHLVIVANQLHSPQMIEEFISLTRQQQSAG